MTSLDLSTAPALTATAPSGRRLGRNASFWTAAFVIAICLWGSGTPSLLYPVYAAAWHLTPTVITTVFAAYPLALVVMLFVAGGGSRPVRPPPPHPAGPPS